MTIIDISAVQRFLQTAFPEMKSILDLEIEDLTANGSRIRLPSRAIILRAGGTISGPTLMTFADVSMYVTLLAVLGLEERAVTSSLHINFLKRAPRGDLVADTRLLKVGRTTAVGNVTILPADDNGDDDVIAVATVTYALPR